MASRKNAKTISSRTGTARKNSTTSHAGQRTQPRSDSLATPKTRPKTTAKMIEKKAILRVSRRPSTRMYSTYSGVKNGSQSAYSSCPAS